MRRKPLSDIPTIGIEDMYANYLRDFNKIIAFLENERDKTIKSRNAIMDSFFRNETYKFTIQNGTNINIGLLDTLIDLKFINQLYIVSWLQEDNAKFSKEFGFNFIESIKDNLINVISLNIKKAKLEKKIKILNKRIVSFDVYKEILKMYNTELATMIVRDYYTFRMGHGLSKIKCVKQIAYPRKNEQGVWVFPMNKKKTWANYRALVKQGVKHPKQKDFIEYFFEGEAYWIHWYKGFCYKKGKRLMKFNPVMGRNIPDKDSVSEEYYKERTKYVKDFKDLSFGMKLNHLMNYNREIVQNYPVYRDRPFKIEEGDLIKGINC